MNQSAELVVVNNFQTKDEFEEIFRTYYSGLCAFANKFLQDKDAAEEIVQDIFVKLWKNRNELEVKTSIKSYLYRSVRNGSLNLIKHIKVREEFKKFNQETIDRSEQLLEDVIVASELEEKIRWSIDQLPRERKKVFMLSRYEGLKYREIAEKLNISVKTVENQMGQAMKTLRMHLKEYLTVAIIILLEYLKK